MKSHSPSSLSDACHKLQSAFSILQSQLAHFELGLNADKTNVVGIF